MRPSELLEVERLEVSCEGAGVTRETVASLDVFRRSLRGPGLDQMADDISRYWFVAAVFRDPKDLGETIKQMRADGLSDRICVITGNDAEAARRAIAGGNHFGIATFDADGAVNASAVDGGQAAMGVFLQSMDGRADPDKVGGRGEDRPHVYAQLNEDIREGAYVLLASVDGPDQQIVGARLLLKGNCECVLTHEIEAPAASP